MSNLNSVSERKFSIFGLNGEFVVGRSVWVHAEEFVPDKTYYYTTRDVVHVDDVTKRRPGMGGRIVECNPARYWAAVQESKRRSTGESGHVPERALRTRVKVRNFKNRMIAGVDEFEYQKGEASWNEKARMTNARLLQALILRRSGKVSEAERLEVQVARYVDWSRMCRRPASRVGECEKLEWMPPFGSKLSVIAKRGVIVKDVLVSKYDPLYVACKVCGGRTEDVTDRLCLLHYHEDLNQ